MTTPTPIEPPPMPDRLRARVRTAAQSFAGFLIAALVAWANDRWGANLDPVAEPLRLAVEGLVVSVATVLWMVLVTLISKYAPWAERLFIMRGEPVYPEAPEGRSLP